jgi:putative ABC transport system permease protein
VRANGLLLLRGIRWRLGISLLTVLTSAIAVGAAVLGPLYLQAAGDSVVRTTVAGASVAARGATLSAPPGSAPSLGQVQGAERIVEDAGGRNRFYETPITSVLSGVGLASPRSGPVRSQLLSRSGICGVLHFEAGGCSMAFDDVAISDRSARAMGVSVGAVIYASVQGLSKPLRLTVTGIYAVPNFDLSYWWGSASGYFPYGQVTSGSQRIPQLDSLVTSPVTALSVPTQDTPQITGQVPLRPGSVGLAQEGPLRTALSQASASVASRGVTLNTQLDSLLAGADTQRHDMSTIVAVAAVQLVVLAIWVLAGLLVRSSDARQAEIRVARLRGFPPISVLGVSALEPAALCALGLGLGLGAAWGAVVIARDRVLDRSAVISPDLWVFAALAVTVAAIAGALAFGTLRQLRSSDDPDAPAGTRARSRRAGFVADIVLLVLAVVALVALETNGSFSGHSNPLAAAAPGLIALGTAVIAVHCVLFVCRAGVSASAYSDRIAVFLALRQIVRRPAAMRQTRVLIIALCLACFAISAWSVAHANRVAAATFSVGTKEVLTVTPLRTGLEQAVDRVDPRGRFAMPAVYIATPSSTVLAVDASRLSAALPWPSGISRTTLSRTSRLLAPPTAPTISLPDQSVRLAASATVSGAGAAARYLEIGLWVFNPQVGTTIVNLGLLHPGASTYQAAVGGVCPGGCRLAGLGLIPAPGHNAPTAGTVRLTLTGLAVRSASANWTPLRFNAFSGGWRAAVPGIQIQPSGTGGLSLFMPANDTASYAGAVGFATQPMVSPADHPTVLPAAVTSEIESINGIAGVRIAGLDGNTLSVGSTVTATALPRVGANAAMVDLDLLSRLQVGPTTPDSADEVWLGPAAPRDAVAELQAAGLRVDQISAASTVLGQLNQSAPALADDFLLVATIVALLAAAASTLGALGANTRQRATELTALQITGVPRPVLARSLAFESAVLAVTALFGAVGGILAAIMAIPSLPELGSPALIPLQYGLPADLVAAVSAAVVVVILLATAAVAAVLVRRMSPILLRMAPNDSAG